MKFGAISDGTIYRDDPKRAQTMNRRHAAIDAELETALERLVTLETK